MVEEGERALFGQRDQPQRELGHLGRERISVDTVEAVIHDEATRGQCDIVIVGAQYTQRPVRLDMGSGGLDQPLREVATGGDEDRTGADGGIAYTEREDFLRLPNPPLGRLAP